MADWTAATQIPGLLAAQPQAPVAQTAVAIQQTPQQPYGSPQGGVASPRRTTRRANVPNHLVKSILVTLFCNGCGIGFILGIIAIIFAAQVDGKVARGDVTGARSASNTANLCSNIAIWLTVGSVVLGLMFYLLLFLGAAAGGGF